jgi:hypothetical protein
MEIRLQPRLVYEVYKYSFYALCVMFLCIWAVTTLVQSVQDDLQHMEYGLRTNASQGTATSYLEGNFGPND